MINSRLKRLQKTTTTTLREVITKNSSLIVSLVLDDVVYLSPVSFHSSTIPRL